MSFFFDRKSTGIPRNATFRLTQEGQSKLQEFTGDPKSQILLALETGGTSDTEEISRACRLSRGQIERLIPILMRGGYIQPVSASPISDSLGG